MYNLLWNSITGTGSFVIIIGIAAYSSGMNQKFTADSKPAMKTRNDVSRPNIIYILADDIGFGEMGFYA